MEQILYGFIGLFILWAKTPNVFMGKKVVNSVQFFPTMIWNDPTGSGIRMDMRVRFRCRTEAFENGHFLYNCFGEAILGNFKVKPNYVSLPPNV
jgi:hypothetical protein